MSNERWQRVEEICHAALERAPGERPAYVRDACVGDDALRAEVESLLANASAAEGSGLGIRDLGLELIGQQIGVYQIVSLLGAGVPVVTETRLPPVAHRSCGKPAILMG